MRSNRSAMSAAAAPLAPSAETTSKKTAKPAIHLVTSRPKAPAGEPVAASDDTVSAPARIAKVAPRSAGRAGEDGPGDTTLARYFRDMALHDVMGAEEELRTAVAVEEAEVEYW